MIDPRSVAADHGPGETPSPGHRFLNDGYGLNLAAGGAGTKRAILINRLAGKRRKITESIAG
jgi:hypothetical protein